MTLAHYLKSLETLARTYISSPGAYKHEKRQRLYLKDMDCPEEWANQLKKIMPECVYYLNDCIEPRTGGDGAIREPNEYGQMMYGKGAAPAGDLMSSLPPDMRALNMMCYIGHEGTYTPAHREMCASLGQNIMVEASVDGKGERAGSSIWFMTETSERELVSEYFLSMLGHDIEVEKHFAQLNAWKKAPFNVWVVEQKVGDLILIPPLAPHQVWNRGTRTMKAAWNRTTIDTLELALHEALPRARMVCRDEQYKCKAIIYYTLANYYELLQRDTIEPKMWKYGRIKQLLDDFKRLFDLYQEILVSEMFSPKLPEETDVEMVPYDSNVTCSYCRCNIFNRFLTCKSCILWSDDGKIEDAYDVCMDCYAMGRSCACISNLKWVEQWDWTALVQNYETWRNIVVQSDGFFDHRRSPQIIDIARKRYGKKPIAEVCQEQLKLRPFVDITIAKQMTPEMSESEPEVDDEGRVKKKKNKKTSKTAVKLKGKTKTCHICFHHHEAWKMAFCTTCNSALCYGVLWRAFDMMPQTVMEDKEWQCPKCLKICSCGKCRKGETQQPYEPKGTLLGHDTRLVADYRSVESLVDFSKTNLQWLRDSDTRNPQESARMLRLKEKAETSKAQVSLVNENYLDPSDASRGDDPFVGADEEDIDPELRGTAPSVNGNGQYRSPYDVGRSAAIATNGDGPTNNWQDGIYELDDNDPHDNPNSVKYPTGLLAPVAPMGTTDIEHTYPDPTQVGPTRMMGIGFYQQERNDPDRIRYDAPTKPDAAPPVEADPYKNPNALAFSDLLDPVLQAQMAKKRKRNADDDEDDDDFFTSKKARQTQRAKTEADELDFDGFMRPEKVPPRRRGAKVKSYVDLGEDAVPIEDDEGPSLISLSRHPAKPRAPRPPKRKSEDNDPNSELAAQALSLLGDPASEKRKGRPRRGQGASDSPLSRAPNTIKTPRRSAWLARKEAEEEEDGTQYPEALPAKRTRQRRSNGVDDSANTASPAIIIPSDHSDSEDIDEGGVDIHMNNDIDSLFGEPVEKDNDIEWRPSEADPNVKIAAVRNEAGNRNASELAEPIVSAESDGSVFKPSKSTKDAAPFKQSAQPRVVLNASTNGRGTEEADKPVPVKRGRGRPPKSIPPPQLDSPSPPPPPPPLQSAAPIKQLLSLKEKLALKGKGFKIVAGSNGASASKSPAPKSSMKNASAPSPVGWNSVNNGDVMLSSVSGTSTPAAASTSKSTPIPTQSAPPKLKGPTVVRLVSPDSDSDEPNHYQSARSKESDDCSSSDDDIPAVSMAARGGGVSLRGRGSGKPRGRPSRIQQRY